MGHTRLGTILKSRKWTAVVAELDRLESVTLPGGSGFPESIAVIAGRTLEAAEVGLNKAVNEQGLRYAFYLLSQLALSAREENWSRALQQIGIELSEDSSVFDLTIELQSAIDRHISTFSHPSDISEIAQRAVGDAISALAASEAVTLFGSGRDELQTAIRPLSTKKGFSELGQVFFARFISRFLNFYLSRLTAGKFVQVGDVSSFNRALQVHCEQSALVVRDFCGEWFSKTEYLEGIDLDNASRFVAVAVKKLQSGLKRQKAES